METPQFVDAVKLSLDKDLSDMLYNRLVSARDAMALQMLRLARGRAFVITTVGTSVEGWTADGMQWFPSEPGTFTTGGSYVPPEGE
jgi:hypothetical protein